MGNTGGFILTILKDINTAIKKKVIFTNQTKITISGVTDLGLIDIWIGFPQDINYVLNRHRLNTMLLNKTRSGKYSLYDWRDSDNLHPVVFDARSSSFTFEFDSPKTGYVVYA